MSTTKQLSETERMIHDAQYPSEISNFLAARDLRGDCGYEPRLSVGAGYEAGEMILRVGPDERTRQYWAWCERYRHKGRIDASDYEIRERTAPVNGQVYLDCIVKAAVYVDGEVVATGVAQRSVSAGVESECNNLVSMVATAAKNRALSNAGFVTFSGDISLANAANKEKDSQEASPVHVEATAQPSAPAASAPAASAPAASAPAASAPAASAPAPSAPAPSAPAPSAPAPSAPAPSAPAASAPAARSKATRSRSSAKNKPAATPAPAAPVPEDDAPEVEEIDPNQTALGDVIPDSDNILPSTSPETKTDENTASKTDPSVEPASTEPEEAKAAPKNSVGSAVTVNITPPVKERIDESNNEGTVEESAKEPAEEPTGEPVVPDTTHSAATSDTSAPYIPCEYTEDEVAAAKGFIIPMLCSKWDNLPLGAVLDQEPSLLSKLAKHTRYKDLAAAAKILVTQIPQSFTALMDEI